MEIVFTFYNTHSVITGEKAMLSQNLPVQVAEIPTAVSAGCGLCLRLPPEYLEQGFSALHSCHIAVQECYRQVQGEYEKIDEKGAFYTC